MTQFSLQGNIYGPKEGENGPIYRSDKAEGSREFIGLSMKNVDVDVDVDVDVLALTDHLRIKNRYWPPPISVHVHLPIKFATLPWTHYKHLKHQPAASMWECFLYMVHSAANTSSS